MVSLCIHKEEMALGMTSTKFKKIMGKNIDATLSLVQFVI
jgi:hypothetical protein